MASKRESDLAFQISELERTAREQKATLEEYSHEQDGSIDTLDITRYMYRVLIIFMTSLHWFVYLFSMKINNNHLEGEH